MSNYSKTTDFAAKDSLPSGDSGKIIRGSEFETEFDAISTAIATKADAANPTFTGTVTIDGLTVNGNTTLGNAATDTVTVTADIASNLIPSADDTYNLGASGAEWNDLYIDGTANIDSLVADTADINGGTIDGVTIGGTTAGALTATTISGTTITGSGDMAIDTDTLFVDVSADRVGVNTSSPASALDVNGTVTSDGLTVDGSSSGDITFTGASASNAGLFVKDPTAATYGAFFGYDDANTVVHIGGVTDGTKNAALVIGRDNNIVQFSGGGDVQFYEDTGTTVKMNWDSSAESLGIGVGTPQASLHIANDASRTQFIASGTVGNDRFLAIDVDITGNENVAYITVDQADALAFGEKTNDNDRTIANEHMRIDASGNVGIGTSSPNSTLEVSATSDGGDVEGIRLTNSSTTANSSSSIMFNTSTGDVDSAKISSTRIDGSNNDLRFSQRRGGALTEAMRIDESGNVGIGTTSPGGLLAAHTGTDSSDILALSGGNSGRYLKVQSFSSGAGFSLDATSSEGVITLKTVGTERLRVANDGKVGIGTSSPSTTLTVAGSSANGLELDRNGADAASSARLFFDSSTSCSAMFNSGGNLVFATGATPGSASGTERVRMDSSGHLIIPNGVTLGTAVGTYAAANTLDDYEEGTFTPSFSGGDYTFTYNKQKGSYTKIGNRVFVDMLLYIDSSTAPSGSTDGDLSVTGLPFAFNAQNSVDILAVSIGFKQQIVNAEDSLSVRFASGNSSFTIVKDLSTGFPDASLLQASDLVANSRLRIQFSYPTNS